MDKNNKKPTGAFHKRSTRATAQLNYSFSTPVQTQAGRLARTPPQAAPVPAEDAMANLSRQEAALQAMMGVQTLTSPLATTLPSLTPNTSHTSVSGAMGLATSTGTTVTFTSMAPISASGTSNISTSHSHAPISTGDSIIVNRPYQGALAQSALAQSALAQGLFTPAGDPNWLWDRSCDPYRAPPNKQTEISTEPPSEMAEMAKRIGALTDYVYSLQHALLSKAKQSSPSRPNTLDLPKAETPPLQGPNAPNVVPELPNVQAPAHQSRNPNRHAENEPGVGPEQMVRSRSPLSRWQLRFDGTSATMSVEAFLHRLDKFQHADQVSNGYVMQNLHRLLSGRAEKWYWLYESDNPNADWPTYRAALLTHFRGPASAAMDDRIIGEIVSRKQGPRETVDAFCTAVLELNNRLSARRSEASLIDTMRRNLLPRLSNAVLTTPFCTLEDFRNTCQMVETHLAQQARYESRNVHDLHQDFATDDTADIEAYDQPQQQRARPPPIDQSRWKCWNCDQQGHSFRDCLSPVQGVFCFKCGYKDVIKLNCPRCQQGNAMPPVRHPGDSRHQRNISGMEPQK